MNELKEIVELLDGYTIEKVGYRLTHAEKRINGWQVKGVSYIKEAEEAVFGTDEPDVADMIVRLSDRGGKWIVSKLIVWKSPKGIVFKMLLRKVENEEKASSDTEEDLETEKQA